MPSVSQVANSTKQPPLGYLPASMFEKIQMDDAQELAGMQEENIYHGLVGSAVDSLTRFLRTKDVRKAFDLSFAGATIAQKYCGYSYDNGSYKIAEQLADRILRLDDSAITAACRLVSFNVWTIGNLRVARSSLQPIDIKPNAAVIQNIRIMVERGVQFIDKYGPLLRPGFSFADIDCTAKVHCGGGDFLTCDGMWDFKVSKQKTIPSAWRLQILMYYIMSQHSADPLYENVKRIGFFNPRQNVVYQIWTKDIPEETIETVAKNVIGFHHSRLSDDRIAVIKQKREEDQLLFGVDPESRFRYGFYG